MPAVQLVKARLVELTRAFGVPSATERDRYPGGLEFQFNPETLKVAYAYSAPPPATGSAAPDGAQMPATATAKLTATAWFDATDDPAGDVRAATSRLVYFITPAKKPGEELTTAPAARFEWGAFTFDGTVDAVEESLEFFAEDGRALRAAVTFGMSRGGLAKVPPAGAGGPGTRPLTLSVGGSLPQLLAAAGGGAAWQAVAAANGIENPRRVAPGVYVDLSAGRG